jgi:uncharacterized membrane protein YfcA
MQNNKGNLVQRVYTNHNNITTFGGRKMWLIIATLCAFYVKGLCGFANTLVFTSILGFTANNINISPLELVLGYPTNLMVAWKEKKHINWKVCIKLSALVIVGSIVGILILKNADVRIIKIIFGVVVILTGIEMLIREFGKRRFKESELALTMIGLVSGILCGIYGVGALLAAYIGRVTEDSKSFRGNICIVFFVENTFRLFAYSMTGIITFKIIKDALFLSPIMLLGIFLGMKSASILEERIVKKMVILLLILSGVILILKNLIL